MRPVKVNNSSNYWTDFEAELSIYLHIKWGSQNAIDYFKSKESLFVAEYIRIAEKYGICVPLQESYESSKSLYSLYLRGKNIIYPTKLFLSEEDNKPYSVVSLDPLVYEIDQLETFFSYPIRVELIKKELEFRIILYISNDIFFPFIDNKKTKSDSFTRNENTLIDNSALAYLNTPRLNSFIRDLKKLSIEFGANAIELENLGLEGFSEDGVLFGNEVVYYEDIQDMLSPQHQIVKAI